MPVTAQETKVLEEGQDKEALSVNFTNGAREQLQILKDHFNLHDELDVVKLGISLIQSIKERDDKKKRE